MTVRSTNRPLVRWLLMPALFALALLLLQGPATPAEAASFRNHIARVPDTPTSAETVTVWIESDTALGETAGVETKISGTFTKYLGTFDDTNGPDPSNWKVVLPAQPNGTFVEYQLFTRNEFGSDYGFTLFNWSYTVNNGDIQWDGLKHDTFDGYYRSPFGAVAADTDVTLRFRTIPLDVDGVDVVVYTYDPATNSTSGPITSPMTYLEDKVEDSVNYAIWAITLDTPNTPAILYYKFKVTDGLDVDWYSDVHSGAHDNLNQGGTGGAADNEPNDAFQLTVYDPDFETPEWLQNANVYQIFPDRFRNGDPDNDYCPAGSSPGDADCPFFYGDQDILARSPWNTLIGDPRVAGPYFNEYGTQFYGGDLQGLIDKLDYLQDLGIDTLYLTPIFDGQSNHRYDTDNYLAIDPALGTTADFQALTAELDARGMYIILDGVFNHTSSDSLYFDRYHRYAGDGACESLGSTYRPWFVFFNNDAPCGAGDYEGWFGFDSLAVLQDGNADARDFIYRDEDSVVDYWYEQGAAGWRFDVTDEISHDWWRDFRPYAKASDGDGPLVGEVWPDASAFLLGDQLDSVMNYRFRKNTLGFARGVDWNDNDNNGSNEIIGLTPSQFDRALKSVREDYPPQATAAMLNLLDSHDTNRALYVLTLLGDSGLTEAKERLALSALFQFTYVGAPMVYYGDEIALDSPSLANGVNGPEDDPYNRAPYPWEDEGGDTGIYGPADADVLDTYTTLANLRQNREALRTGDFVTLLTGDTTASGSDNNTYAFARDGATETAIVALNNGGGGNTAVIDVSAFYSNGDELEDKLTGDLYTVAGGNVSLTLPARSGVVLLPILPSSITVEKVVVGNAPADPWAFSGDLGSFTLPAGGGDTTFNALAASGYTISETDLGGWVAAVSCNPGGESGGASVTMTLSDGEDATCTFTNTLCQPGRYDDGAACALADPGYYVDVPGAVAPIACVPGYYQPAAGQTACLLADAGYYVDTPAATAQTACPLGTTSPSGSDSINDCVGTTADLTIVKETDPAGGTGFPFTLDPGAVTFADKWGSNGVGQGQFNGPFGIVVDGAGNVYVADTFAYRVQKFDADGNFILAWGRDVKVGGVTGYEVCLPADTCKAGTSGTANGEFNLPHGVAVDGAGNVYVVDSSNHRIQVFDANGVYLDQWGGGGSGAGLFNNPNGVALDSAGNVYVADTFNNRIQKFDAGGNFLLAWGYNVVDGGGINFEICTPTDTCKAGESATGSGAFNTPSGVAVFGANVYVADSINNRIQKFDSEGNYLAGWGSAGSGNGEFNWPFGLTTDAAGNVYVADSENDRVQKFDADGNYLNQWGSAGTNDGQFNQPTGVVVSGASVYVTEYQGHRVQRFTQTGATLDDDESHAFEDLAPGSYLLSELVPADWTLTDIDCDGGSPAESGNTVSVTLAGGNDVTCAFSNTYTPPPPTTGTIVIVKEADPADDTEFTFTENILNTGFGLTDPADNSKTFSDVPTGGYSVTEAETANWTLDNIDCDDSNSTGDTGTRTATVNLEDGEIVTCTFYNSESPIDIDPPETTIDTAPPSLTNNNDPSFTFSSDESGSTFECKLDTGDWEACNGGAKSYTNVADGEHTFYARATDAASNTDPTPDSHTWTIDTAGPTVTIDTAPPSLTNNNDPSFTFSSEAGATFECKLDTGAWESCDSPKSYTDLGEGEHTFQVRATDAAGNTGAADSHTWTIDTAAPDTSLTDAPNDPSNDSSPSFTFNSSETGSTFTCQLDSGPAETCAGSKSYTGLSDGEHTFTVFATDAAGNSDPTPAGHTWTIDTTSPPDAAVFVSTTAAGSVGGLSFGSEDILKWDGSAWSKWFDGSDAGLTARNAIHNINAFWIPDSSGDDLVLSFAQNRRAVPDITPKVDGTDLVRWDGSAFSFYFDGSDVGLTVLTQEKIDGLHVLPGEDSPIGAGCQAYLLISTQGPGKVPNYSGGTLNFSGEDVLGFCATALGETTAGLWHMVLDGSLQGMPKNATDSISLSEDGNTLYLTTKGTFNVDSASGGHSAVYAYDVTTTQFSGPIFITAANGLPKKVDGLQVE